ncbi:GNAT family N-acetyltransferase [Paenibacillus sp. MMS18-CY102]|uniref:GNAT family N-acetyltransferase n=1 Tax=Paenibacillus sp. MMS18-CY102 TaxID=2682849 RepID=UPI001365D336|nr:GNAT family N-acetyltransferase [Paenibacillus sp. MMS18-CY102]MWC29346.1 GNAT family N-acetyltransferase [Paenibacillus sp. MMS18-CY102]
MKIIVDDLTGPEVQALIQEHLKGMHEDTPPESVYALGIDELKKPGVTFWSAWEDDEILGCGAIKELDSSHGELKSMRTSAAHLRKGVARHILERILQEAKDRGYKRISLETGSLPSFKPATKLYESFGFEYCGPFADYPEDPYSLFMTKEL